jgi:2-iminobutanoate/2-iminopropanoate deaminase
MVDRNDRGAVTEPRLALFGDHRQPHTGLVIAGLGSPDVKIEVEVITYLITGAPVTIPTHSNVAHSGSCRG